AAPWPLAQSLVPVPLHRSRWLLTSTKLEGGTPAAETTWTNRPVLTIAVAPRTTASRRRTGILTRCICSPFRLTSDPQLLQLNRLLASPAPSLPCFCQLHGVASPPRRGSLSALLIGGRAVRSSRKPAALRAPRADARSTGSGARLHPCDAHE